MESGRLRKGGSVHRWGEGKERREDWPRGKGGRGRDESKLRQDLTLRETGEAEAEQLQPPPRLEPAEGERKRAKEEGKSSREEEDSVTREDLQKRQQLSQQPELEENEKDSLHAITWNVEGKRRREEIEADVPGWDVLCLQEAPGEFEAAGHIVVRKECCWRACALVLYRRWATTLISASDAEAFPTMQIRWGESAIMVVSCYLPHNRSLRGSWHQEFTKLKGQVARAKEAAKGTHISVGGDLGRDRSRTGSPGEDLPLPGRHLVSKPGAGHEGGTRQQEPKGRVPQAEMAEREGGGRRAIQRPLEARSVGRPRRCRAGHTKGGSR